MNKHKPQSHIAIYWIAMSILFLGLLFLGYLLHFNFLFVYWGIVLIGTTLLGKTETLKVTSYFEQVYPEQWEEIKQDEYLKSFRVNRIIEKSYKMDDPVLKKIVTDHLRFLFFTIIAMFLPVIVGAIIKIVRFF